jgi:hypothetical protein
MTPIATKNNAIILKDGKLAEGCGCCGEWYCYDQRDPCCKCNFGSQQSISLTITAPDFPASMDMRYESPPAGAAAGGLYNGQGYNPPIQESYGTFTYTISDYLSGGTTVIPCLYVVKTHAFSYNNALHDYYPVADPGYVELYFSHGYVAPFTNSPQGITPLFIPARLHGSLLVVSASPHMFPTFGYASQVFRVWELANLTGDYNCNLSQWTWTHQGTLFRFGSRTVYSWLGLPQISVGIQ